MRTYKNNGKEEMRLGMFFLLNIVFLFLMNCSVRADLVFDSGYNTYDESYGYNAEVWVINDAHLYVLSGSMGKLETQNYSTANIYDGTMGTLTTTDNSIVNIYDGTIDWPWSGFNSIVNIYGGQLGEYFTHADSIVKLYAYNTIYHSTGVPNNKPWIEGVYLISDEPFNFSFYDEESYSRFQIVPEPATILLFCSGILLLKKKL